MQTVEQAIDHIYKRVSFMCTDVEQERRKKYLDNRINIINYVTQKLSEGDYYISTWTDDSIYDKRCLLWVVDVKTKESILKEFK